MPRTTTAQIIAAMPTTCEKCGQAAISVVDGDAYLIRTGHLVCHPCFDAYEARCREPQGEAMRLFAPAPNQIPGQMNL